MLDICLDTLPYVELENRDTIPRKQGIYFAIDREGLVLYMGLSKNLNRACADDPDVVALAYRLGGKEAMIKAIEQCSGRILSVKPISPFVVKHQRRWRFDR